DLPRQLGCTLLEDGCVEVDHANKTSVPGVYAAGDMARPVYQPVPIAYVASAANDGLVAAGFIDADLFGSSFQQLARRKENTWTPSARRPNGRQQPGHTRASARTVSSQTPGRARWRVLRGYGWRRSSRRLQEATPTCRSGPASTTIC